jgi:hypothetical protein
MATRKVTKQLLQLIEDGVLDPQTVLEACLSYMSEAEVADMARDHVATWPTATSSSRKTKKKKKKTTSDTGAKFNSDLIG